MLVLVDLAVAAPRSIPVLAGLPTAAAGAAVARQRSPLPAAVGDPELS